MPILEVLKQLQALVSGGMPFLAKQFSLLPFLNPQIADEQWPIASVIALVASGLTYNLFQRFERPAAILAVLGLVTAVISTLFLLALVDGLMFSGRPELQDFSARSLFVLLFVGIGLASGYSFGRII